LSSDEKREIFSQNDAEIVLDKNPKYAQTAKVSK